MLKLFSYLPILSRPEPTICARCLTVCSICRTLLLIDPVVLSALPALDLTLFKPEGNFLLGVLDGVGTVADVASDYLTKKLGPEDI